MEKEKYKTDAEGGDEGVEEEVEALKAENRGQWGSQAEFILSCVGYAVGLGNVWRFPYLCYINGGGAFLIPYIIMMIFVGIPTFFIELGIGQYGRGGPYTVWSKLSPLFKGVGFGMLIITLISNIYYQIIIAWSLYYLFATFQSRLPWSHCDNDFNTDYCYARKEAEEDCETKENPGAVFFNQTCYLQEDVQNITATNYTCSISVLKNCTETADYSCTLEQYLDEFTECKRSGSGEEFFNFGMLNLSDSIEDNGEMQWELVLVLLLSWIICCLCVIKGIQSAGKVVYFTATFPYLVLIILLIRGATLDGAKDGIEFYLKPDWELLKKPKVWADAAGQVFFSLSVGLGGLMSFASYNKFHNNIYRDTLLVTILDAFTAFFSGFAIFSALGYLAKVLNKDVGDVVDSGSGLAFIVYPEVMTYLPVSHLWCILFFLMLLTLGLDSQFAGIENINTFLFDLFPSLRKVKYLVSIGQCSACFILGLTMCSQAGIYWEELMGYYSAGWSLILIALAECTIVAYVYGTSNFMRDIEVMVGFKLYCHWWVMFSIVTPVTLGFILVFNCYEFTPLTYGDYELESWAQALGWLMAVVSIFVIPVLASHTWVKSYKDENLKGSSFCQRFLHLMKPSPEWRLVEELESDKSKDNDRAQTDVFYVATTAPDYSEVVHDNKGYYPSELDDDPGFANGDGAIDTRL